MKKDTLRPVLARSDWFSALPAALADTIIANSHVRHFKDEPVYMTGDPPNGLFALLSGKIRVAHNSSDGRFALLLVANPGAWFGEASTLDGKPRYSDAVVTGKASLLHLDMAAFKRLTKDNQSYYAAFVQLLCRHHRFAMDHIVSSATLSVATRAAQKLLIFAHAEGKSRPDSKLIELHLSQEHLATSIGISRQTLNSVLKTFERQGIISVRYARIIIENPAALEKMAGENSMIELNLHR